MRIYLQLYGFIVYFVTYGCDCGTMSYMRGMADVEWDEIKLQNDKTIK